METAIVIDPAALAGLSNKTVIITGGASGIGLEAGKLFHSLGSNVVLADLNHPLEESVLSTSNRAMFVECDITKWTSLRHLFDITKSKFGQVDIVCANAGINEFNDQFFRVDSDGQPQEPDQRTLDVNLKGTINTVALSMNAMSESGGSIIITASLGGYFGVPKMPLYVASKHGLVGLMRSLWSDALSKNIAISLVAPGMTPTPILARLPSVPQEQENINIDLEELYSSIRASGIPSNTTAVVAQAIAYLASMGSSAAGQGLLVSGDMIHDVELSIRETWPDYVRNAAGFILKSSAGLVYEHKTT